MESSVSNSNNSTSNEHIDRLVKLYFSGYSIADALKIVRADKEKENVEY
jgi:hypothetical protein